jgi:hypothetical protein
LKHDSTHLKLNQSLDLEDRNLIMQLSPLYEQRLAEAREQGVKQGIQQGVEQSVQSAI